MNLPLIPVDEKEFEHQLIQTLYAASPIAALANKIEYLTGYPVYFTNYYWEFYASSPSIHQEEIIKLADLLHSAQLSSKTYTDYLNQKAKLSEILGESPAMIYIPKQHRHYLFAFSYHNYNKNGIVVFPEKRKPLAELPKAYLDIILSVFSLAQTIHSASKNHKQEYEGWSSIFRKLFSGEIKDRQQLLAELQNNSLIVYIKSYVIFVFTVRSKAIHETGIADQLSEYLKTLQYFHTWFEYHGSIVMVLNDDRMQTNTNELIQSSNFQTIIRSLELYVGYSNSLSNLLDAKQGYLDAFTAAKFSRRWDVSLHISSYEECKLYDLLNHIQGNRTSLKHYISQSIVFIQEYDAEHGTDYYQTLELLVKNRMNLTATAAQLFIHKSTLFYRMQQMKKLFQIDWDNPTTILHLQLSLYMLNYLLE